MDRNKQDIDVVKLLLECIILIVSLIVVEKVLSPYFPDYIMPVRCKWLDGYIGDVNKGFFPQISESGNSDHCLGIYILGAYLGDILKMSARETFRFISIISFSTTIIVFPFLIHIIYRNKLITYLSPLLLCMFFSDYLLTSYHDTYVAMGISMVVLSVPLVKILISCQRRTHKILIYIVLIILLSLANIAREHTSLGLLIALGYFIILEVGTAWRSRRWGDVFVFLFMGFFGILSYNLLVNTIPSILLKMNGQKQLLTVSTAWHNIYIGFGYFDNPYGIVYLDEFAYAKVREISANAICPSDEYFIICKELVMELVNKDLGFCVKSIILKALFLCGGWMIVTLRRASRLICIIYIMYNAYKEWKLSRRWHYRIINKQMIVACSLLVLFGALQAVLTIPSITYSVTAYATIQVLIMMQVFVVLRDKQSRKNLNYDEKM